MIIKNKNIMSLLTMYTLQQVMIEKTLAKRFDTRKLESIHKLLDSSQQIERYISMMHCVKKT